MTTTVASVTPDFDTYAGGKSVIITGTGLTGASAVTFGGQHATSFTVNSDTEIHATVPPIPAPLTPGGAANNVNVFVTVGGTEYDGASFVWVAAPAQIAWVSATAVVTGISPTSGAYPGGQTMTITGVGFSHVVEVDFTYGTSNAWYPASFTINSDTQITATVPAIPVGYEGGTFYVTVTTGAGVSPTGSACAFDYTA